MRTERPLSYPDPRRLYRNPGNGKVFGVCAGLADFLSIDTFPVRAAVVIGLFFLSLPVIIAYLLAALILPVRPPAPARSDAEDAFLSALAARPQATVTTLQKRFQELERRLRGLESHVASHEFEIGRAIRDLDR